MSKQQTEVPYGTLDLLILKTLETMGTMHGYAIARRIEQVCGRRAAVEPGLGLSRPDPPAAGRLDPHGLGNFGDQSEGQVLFADHGRAEATARGGSELGEGRRPWWPAFWRRRHDASARGGSACWRWSASGVSIGELEDEILAHLELAERDALARGLSPEEARRAARRSFGGIEQMKEEHRDQPQLSMDRNAAERFSIRAGFAAGARPASPPLSWACWRSALGPTSPCSAWSTPSC